jgi:hypothetical protein
MGKRKTDFEESASVNNRTFNLYLKMLTELAISRFGWENMPPSVDVRYLETELFLNGCAVYFNDAELDENLCLSCLPGGRFNVYGEPVQRRGYSRYNNANYQLNDKNSVIIWNNLLRSNDYDTATLFARRMYNLDRIIDVNANAQKTPVLVRATEKQRLTLLNIYEQYDGNSPVIYGDTDLDPQALRVMSTGAPYVADKLYQLKTQYWNEALTRLGISNVNTQKKERMISDEVTRTQGGTIASRFSGLEARKQAADKINAMFGTNIKPYYREDTEISNIPYVSLETYDEEGGEDE